MHLLTAPATGTQRLADVTAAVTRIQTLHTLATALEQCEESGPVTYLIVRPPALNEPTEVSAYNDAGDRIATVTIPGQLSVPDDFRARPDVEHLDEDGIARLRTLDVEQLLLDQVAPLLAPF